jgi:hypothetical protein
MKKALLVEYPSLGGVMFTQKFRVVESQKGLDWVYEAIGANLFDIVNFGRWEAYVDDEGLLKAGNAVIEYANGASLEGLLLVYKGVDNSGYPLYFETDQEIEEAKAYFENFNLRGVVQ